MNRPWLRETDNSRNAYCCSSSACFAAFGGRCAVSARDPDGFSDILLVRHSGRVVLHWVYASDIGAAKCSARYLRGAERVRRKGTRWDGWRDEKVGRVRGEVMLRKGGRLDGKAGR